MGGLRSFLGLQTILAHFGMFNWTSLLNPQLTSQEPHLTYPPTMTGQPSAHSREGYFSRLYCCPGTSIRGVFRLYDICPSIPAYNRSHLRGLGVLSIRAADRTGLKGLLRINRDYPPKTRENLPATPVSRTGLEPQTTGVPQTRQTATRARPNCR